MQDTKLASFHARVIQGRRITIPEATADAFGIEKGDLVEVTIRKIKEASKEQS